MKDSANEFEIASARSNQGLAMTGEGERIWQKAQA